jgi:hypothetical protein
MDSRVYWSLILYYLFARVMFADWGNGVLDALSSVAFVAGTVYLAYNMRWHSYSKERFTCRPVGDWKKNEEGKRTINVETTREENDIVADVGFWFFWLILLFILDLLNITIIALFVIVAFALCAYASVSARKWYDRAMPWVVRKYQEERKVVDAFLKRFR